MQRLATAVFSSFSSVLVASLLLTSCSSSNKGSSSNGINYKLKKNETLEPYPGLKIQSYTMANGMKVLLVPRNQNGTLAITVGYSVGSRHEEPGKTGLAHLFEHMMFRGTESFPTPFRTLSEWGGEFNAFTSFDQTVYYELVPAQKLEEALRFESERMRKLLITPEIFKTERGAVVSERKMGYEDSPSGRAGWEIHQLAFDKHPYKTTPIGWQEDIDRASFEDALSFYNRYYAPNRATLVLVGDFNEDKALSLIEKYYGKYKAVESKDRINPKENIYRKNREKTIRLRAQSVIMVDAVFGPSFHDPNAAAEFFFCVLLGDSDLGYLRNQLVETNIARSASASCYPYVDPSLSTIRIVASPGVSSKKLKQKYAQAWKGFIPWIKGDRFENSKKLFETSQLESLRSPMELAQTLVTNSTAAGDPLYTFKLVEKIKTLKREDIIARYKEWKKRGGTRIIIEPSAKNDPMRKGK
ncbi:MAG: pitrilysin family protein [Bdellovibrionota bacterium]